MSDPNDQSANTFDEYAELEAYEAACEQGLRLSGESRDYFVRSRVEHTSVLCRDVAETGRILDFGCGLGHAAPHLMAAFPGADLIGVDASAAVVREARARYGGDRVRFSASLGDVEPGSIDLIYCNGVFHHIEVKDRPLVAATLFSLLASGGCFALWENNPWNPGTRLVMSRIPFDRDALPITPPHACVFLREAGFEVVSTTHHFYFPAVLGFLRRWEPRLINIPLGAQYCVLARHG